MNTKVSNPLTVVAIFAALAEMLATISLINLPQEIQATFVWFVMFFPLFIVTIFFAILNWNHSVLYAPGDFKNEEIYLETLKLKESVKDEFISSISSGSATGLSLTPDQVKAITERLDCVVERASMDSRKEKVLSFLIDGELSTSEIDEKMNISKVYVYRLLNDLLSEGKVTQRKEGRHAYWSLPETQNVQQNNVRDN